MKPAPFEYVRAETLTDAVEALGASEDARVLAGGQSLLPLMNLRLATPGVLVDVNRLDDLDFVRGNSAAMRVGALCRHRRLELDPEIRVQVPLLAEAAALIGHTQIRNRGTLGGSLAHGDPAAELGAALLALEGRVRVTSSRGSREIAAADVFTGFLSTSLAPGELLIEAIVPVRAPREGHAFAEFAARHGDFAVVGVAARVVREEDGRCSQARAAACGLASTPVDLTAALVELIGESALSDDLLRGIAMEVGQVEEPLGDLHASVADRRELVQLLTVQALRRAWDQAAAEGSR